MSSLIFLYPHWLGLLVPLLLLAAWRGLRQNQRGLIAPHLAQAWELKLARGALLGVYWHSVGSSLPLRWRAQAGNPLNVRVCKIAPHVC